MAQRIFERQILGIQEDEVVVGDLMLAAAVDLIDTSRIPGDRVLTTYVGVQIAATDTIVATETKRSAAYKAAWIAAWGGTPPANCILQSIKLV
jgi:hypothetical protein